MADHVSTQSTPDCIILQEKWNENIKKNPIAFSLAIIVFVVTPLLICIYTSDRSILLLFVLFLLINIPSIIKMLSPNHYEVSTTGGRIKILKNGVEVLNVKGQQITFLDYDKHPFAKNEIVKLRINYVDDNSKTKYYSLPLGFIPKADLKELRNYIEDFFAKDVNKDKLTDGENWKAKLIISLVFFVFFAFSCYATKDVSGRMIFALFLSFSFLIISIVKMTKNK